jgi:carbamoyltransferase
MRILGLSAYYHDSAACLVVDGEIVAAAQEERFTRKKHDPDFPTHAVRYCLDQGSINPEQIDYIAFYEKPLRKFERLLETYLAFAPRGFRSFSLALPRWLSEKLRTSSTIRRGITPGRLPPLVFTDHHESHAASAFFPSPFKEAAILTLDGVGEWSTTTLGVGRENKIHLTHHLQFPHSLGLLYSAFTYSCGFKVNSGEYKLMGLAPYGRPVYQEAIYKHLIDVKPDGSFWLNMDYFNYCQGLTMTNRRFDRLFGGAPRNPESNLEQRHMDLAASIQAVTEEVMLRMTRDLHQRTGLRNLVLAGGVALNCVANGRIAREGPFDHIWIQPSAGDAGGALGAALFVWHQLLENDRRVDRRYDGQRGSFLGPKWSSAEIQAFLNDTGVSSMRHPNDADLFDQVAALLADGKVVGWFQGRMEFGPRALGARSILGDPRSPKMQAMLNLKIKFRESFRPFAPAVLEEQAAQWFDMSPGSESPYMLLVAPVLSHRRIAPSTDQARIMAEDPNLCTRVNIERSVVPAITHVDYSARVQTVDEGRNPRFYGLLKAFYARTGCPMLVNTSFNVRGEPIVCTPQDAYRCFLATEMDALVLEDSLLLKKDIAQPYDASEQHAHLAQFQLD